MYGSGDPGEAPEGFLKGAREGELQCMVHHLMVGFQKGYSWVLSMDYQKNILEGRELASGEENSLRTTDRAFDELDEDIPLGASDRTPKALLAGSSDDILYG